MESLEVMSGCKLRIKIITCHDVYNAGASLQAFALSLYLRQLGHDVEIINYKPVYLRHYVLWGVRNLKYDKPILREVYNLLKLPGRIKDRTEKRKKNFDQFTSTYLPVTKQTYANNEKLKINPPLADLYIAGSDQIWNTLFQNGKDPAFYLDFAPKNAICASYAASFATEDIALEWKDQVCEWIRQLDFVSVREKSGINIIQELGVRDVYQVLDPVFLISSQMWNEIVRKMENLEEYLLIYDFDNNEQLNKQAKMLAEKNKLKIFSVFPNAICDKCFSEEGPLIFVKLIKNATIVLSNSFHATAFSIIFEKQFIVFDRKEEINTRMRDLLESLDIRMDGSFIDYAKVKNLLEKQINDSKNYINKVIDAARKGKE